MSRDKEKLKGSEIIFTYDEPEGGLDALVQAIVCKDQIGWRERARHIIVFATDAHSHLVIWLKMLIIHSRN